MTNNSLFPCLLVAFLCGCASTEPPPIAMSLQKLDAGNRHAVFKRPNYALSWVSDQTFEYPRNPPDVCADQIDLVSVDFLLSISNNSSEKVWYYHDGCSWGYESMSLRVLVEGVQYDISRADGTWYRNFPMVEAINPGETIIWPVSLDTRLWNNLPPGLRWQGGMVQIVFDGNFFHDEQCRSPISNNPIASSWLHVVPEDLSPL